MTDFEKALVIMGAVRTGAVILGRTPYSYYRYNYPHYYPHRPIVVVEPQPTIMPVPVVVDREVPVIVDREVPVIVEKEVVVERPVHNEPTPSSVGSDRPATPTTDDPVLLRLQNMQSDETFSPKLGGIFKIEDMQIPGHNFKAARLSSDPLEGSPLYEFGLREGDAITRLGGTAAASFDVLEKHERTVEMRYIKSGTDRVLRAAIYIPTDAELWGDDETPVDP